MHLFIFGTYLSFFSIFLFVLTKFQHLARQIKTQAQDPFGLEINPRALALPLLLHINIDLLEEDVGANLTEGTHECENKGKNVVMLLLLLLIKGFYSHYLLVLIDNFIDLFIKIIP